MKHTLTITLEVSVDSLVLKTSGDVRIGIGLDGVFVSPTMPVCVTRYGRFDQLTRTLRAFTAHHNGRILVDTPDTLTTEIEQD